jgi:hypothetical protein
MIPSLARQPAAGSAAAALVIRALPAAAIPFVIGSPGRPALAQAARATRMERTAA